MKLTLPQQDIYFEQLLYPEESIYNIGANITINGNISYDILNDAYIALINQHDAYRSIVIGNIQDARIETLAKHNTSLGYKDFSKEEVPEQKANEFMRDTFQYVFRFEDKTLLHKFILIKVKDSLHYLFSMYHHIITDGWGTSLMFQRLVKNYNELSNEGKISSEYPYSYKDFIINDIKYAESEDFLKDKIYWKEKFVNLPERFLYKINSSQTTNKSSRKELFIKRIVYNQLEQLARETKSSTFHIILGILYLYFGRKHQVNEFAIGLPVLNRSNSIFKKTVGLFTGVSVLLIDLDYEISFVELIHQIKQQLREDYRHQRFPLGKLINELQLFEDKDRLFNITLSYEKQNYADHFKDTVTSVVPLTHESERVALAIYIREFDKTEDVKIDFDYNINYFDVESIEKVLIHFEFLMHQIAINPEVKLSEYNYITQEEEQKIQIDFNQTASNYPRQTICSLFKSHVTTKSNELAVTDKYNGYTYQTLEVKSNQVANYIIQNYAENNNGTVAVLMDRSADLIVVLLGILKSGYSYIPLDPNFPQERLEYIVKHSEVSMILGEVRYANLVGNTSVYIPIDEVLKETNQASRIIDFSDFTKDAYIIYTSGSTGNPKGVRIGHQSLTNFLISIQQNQKVSSNDLLFSVTTQSFDISILEFFVPLISGGTVYMASKETLSDPFTIIEEIESVQPSILQATPSFYQMLFDAGWKGNEKLKILCGGDLLSKSLAEKMLSVSKEVWNMYGPTETTIWSSTKLIKEADDASNIGKPINNTKMYILDGNKKLVPEGIPGELYISGDGLSKGYVKDEVQTDEKFSIHPFIKGEKIYNTGDLGKWNSKGEIQFLGRNDFQVKIRGYRIELEEIETVLNQFKQIKSSIVVAKKSEAQEAFLVAYVIPEDEAINPSEIILALRGKLPEYMIPHTIVSLDTFPLTPNKKIERKLLLNMELNQIDRINEFVMPNTNLEVKIGEFFQSVLVLDKKISNTDNFFGLGGHSLNAVRLISLVEREFHCQLSLRTIFENPTVKSLSNFIEKGDVKKTKPVLPIAEQVDYPITASQYALWLAALNPEKSIAYNMFASFKIDGEVRKEVLEKALIAIINKYEVLRTNFIEVDGLPRQKVSSKSVNTFIIDEIKSTVETIEEDIVKYACREFDLANEMLLRLGLIQVENNTSYLVFATHHIIMDGWSLEILINELANYYPMLLSETTIVDNSLPFQFKDYVDWLAIKENENEEENQAFWNEYLKLYKWKNLISFDNDLATTEQNVAMYYFSWNEKTLNDLVMLGVKYNSTLHTLLITAFNILIYKMYQHEDICVATVNSGRNFSDSQSQIGMFVKTLPLRSKIQGEKTFLEIINNVHQDLLMLDKYQNMPTDVHNKLRFEILIVLQNTKFNYDTIQLHEQLQLSSHPIKSTYNRLPLLIDFHKKHTELSGTVNYDTSKYQKETLDIIFMKYKKIIDQIILNPTVQIDAIDIDLPFEKQEAVEIDFNF
ncbi:amino acid adenylation domain-containing protein [Flavobacterium sp. '19STA2R22 D10 B1']|uniref:amino acid adenylation domain-containing protein n=1 Tax=Flavobacterium aerium TaxID=3037261 RepID=UPI00278C1CFE|nr:amino acid adenylation domain-containing protein [Flavobacterium sp. '19STA2R22 D10 B1']